MISITDGQLYLDSALFGLGICPAISVDKSVSRVGAKSLDPLMRSVAFRIYLLINEYKQEASAAVKSQLLNSESIGETASLSFYSAVALLRLLFVAFLLLAFTVTSTPSRSPSSSF